MHELIHDVLHDTIIMLPFLYIAYLLMEFIEHKSSQKMKDALTNAKKIGPLVGSFLGLIPQCGFSIIASGFYMNHSITLGTLISIFIATSDDAIPILIAQPNQITNLGILIIIKLIIAIIAGYIIDALISTKRLKDEKSCHDVHEHCEEESKKHPSIFILALIHTLKIFAFVFVVNFVISLIIHLIGVESLQNVLKTGSFIQPIVAALFGLIPNCSASIILASLFSDGVISFGALLAGLISSAGFGLLVLFKMYDNKKDLARIVLILVGIAMFSGMIVSLVM